MNVSGRVQHNNQRGAALMVGLIMLLLLTVIGVAGMRDTMLQERMSGGQRDREMALQSAEAALRAAEELLNDAVPLAINNSGGFYSCVATGMKRAAGQANCSAAGGGAALSETAYWQQYGWQTPGNSASYSLVGVSSGLAQDPRYVIEQLPAGFSRIPNTTNAGVTAPGTKTVRDYRITARAVGSTADSVVILQSSYRRID